MQRTISLGRFQTIILACEQILFISLRIVRIVYLSYIYYRTGNVSRDEDAVSRISEFTIASLGDRFTGGFHQSLGFLTWQVYSYQNIDIMLYYKCCIIIINFIYILSWFFVFKFRKKSSLFIKNIPKKAWKITAEIQIQLLKIHFFKKIGFMIIPANTMS